MPKRRLAELSPVDHLRYQLMILRLSQRGAARALGIDSRTFRYYASGQKPIPQLLNLALEGLISLQNLEEKKALKRRTPKPPGPRKGDLHPLEAPMQRDGAGRYLPRRTMSDDDATDVTS